MSKSLPCARRWLSLQLTFVRSGIGVSRTWHCWTKLEKNYRTPFKSLANDILEEKSSRFTEQNKTNIDQILGPLATKIQEFQAKVEDVHGKDSTDRAALKEQVRQLMSLSERVSDDAKNLADALTGSSKTQGNWGELILERVLEASGLRKGYEYELRETYHYQDGTRGQPDVVIRLPEERHLVIDSKVSLTDYDRYAKAGTDTGRQAALESHVASVRRHIKELSERTITHFANSTRWTWSCCLCPLNRPSRLRLPQTVVCGKRH
jgi:DNA recombination protein RmuC